MHLYESPDARVTDRDVLSIVALLLWALLKHTNILHPFCSGNSDGSSMDNKSEEFQPTALTIWE